MTPDSTPPPAPRSLQTGVVVAALLLTLPAVLAPLPWVVDKVTPDDAFYYYQTARVFARTGFSSFDGLHFTNGYQPLWFLLITPVYWLFPFAEEPPLRIMLMVQVGMLAGATLLLFRQLAGRYGALTASVVMALWLALARPVILNGLETPLLMVIYGALFAAWTRLGNPVSDREAVKLGLLCGLIFLARTDSVFLVGAISVGMLLRLPLWDGKDQAGAYARRLALFAFPLAALAGSYLLSNWLLTGGHLVPVSGAAKQHYAEVARAGLIAQAGSFPGALWKHLAWMLDPNYWFVPFSLIGSLAIVGVAGRDGDSAAILRSGWPFVVGIWGTTVFYNTVYFGPFSTYPWYYAPQVWIACLVAAEIAHWLERRALPPARVPGIAALGVTVLALGAGPTPGFLPGVIAWLLLGALWLAVRHVRRGSALLRVPVALGVFLAAIAPFLLLAKAGVSWIYVWSAILIAAIVLRATLYRGAGQGTDRLDLGFTTLGLTTVVLARLLLGNLLSPPGGYGYTHYQGATWARTHLPTDATIWANNAGILGYFSERTVVNTDGLTNDYDYLENVLLAGPEQTAAYRAQWEYNVDWYQLADKTTFSDEGCYLDIPPDLLPPPFISEFGDFAQLRAYQMHREGIVTCPARD